MNPTKKSPGVNRAPQVKPVVAQLKTGIPAHGAPPVYHLKQTPNFPRAVQQTRPGVLQTKSSSATAKIANSIRPITAKRTASSFSAIQRAAVAVAVNIYEAYHQFTIGGVTYHMNWNLGDSKKGEAVYHVTEEGRPKKHYFFTLQNRVVSDAVAPKGFAGKRTSYKFSRLPAAVQQYVRTHV